MIRRIVPWGFVFVLVLSTSGCAHLRGMWGGGDKHDAEAEAVVTEPATESDVEARLRATVDAQIASTRTEPTLVKAKPYYFKEYQIYPDGAGDYTIDLTEKDSRTAPYMAEVKLPKQRYATKLHRKRGDAREDTNLFRETGTETQTYELRHGDWVYTGSLFVVTKTEEQVNGEWVPAEEEVAKVVSEDSNQGWFGRTWSWITGR